MAGQPRLFSVTEYHTLTQLGILTEDDQVELLEGYLVQKSPKTPAHECVLQRSSRSFLNLLPAGWDLRIQCGVTLPDSELEPDVAVVRGDDSTYQNRHPEPADIGLVMEVSDSSLDGDRADKGRIYARAGLLVYWIVNLVHRQLEVYTQPSGPTSNPAYGQQTVLKIGQTVPLILDGVTVTHIAVHDLLP